MNMEKWANDARESAERDLRKLAVGQAIEAMEMLIGMLRESDQAWKEDERR